MTRARRRPAFTLIELLVVISILGILIALTATAVFGVRKTQQKQNTESLLVKLNGRLDRKMKDITDSINRDVQNSTPEAKTILAACGDNKDVAKAVMLYARTRQQLPMTYLEARTAFTVCGYTYQPDAAFKNLPASGSADQEESAACFYAAVAGYGLEGLDQQVGTNLGGQKVFRDDYDMPVAFNRLGYDGDQGELNKAPSTFDPFYPAKQGAGYRNLATDYDAVRGSGMFNSEVWAYVRPNVGWVPGLPGNYPGVKNHMRYTFSSGNNRDYADSPAGQFAGDNLFSYRLRKEGGKGD